ncbi:MAG: hypothetical protein QXG98_00845 [Candidatus Micrarchaeia archaeon]
MEITITSQKDNPLFGRKEIAFEIRHKGATPSRQVIKAALAQKLGIDPKLIVIGKVRQRFGLSGVTGTANVYADEKDVAVERKYRLARDTGVKGKPKEKKEKPATAPEAPASEKK